MVETGLRQWFSVEMSGDFPSQEAFDDVWTHFWFLHWEGVYTTSLQFVKARDPGLGQSPEQPSTQKKYYLVQNVSSAEGEKPRYKINRETS